MKDLTLPVQTLSESFDHGDGTDFSMAVHLPDGTVMRSSPDNCVMARAMPNGTYGVYIRNYNMT